jgi:hypothetical protein
MKNKSHFGNFGSGIFSYFSGTSFILVFIFNVFYPYAQLKSQNGYWKFQHQVQDSRESRYDNGLSFAGDFGNMLFTHVAKDAISVKNGPPYRVDQTISTRYTWNKPPEILIPGENLNFPLTCMVSINSHPDQGLSLGGAAGVWFGWNPGQGNRFRHESNQEIYELGYAVYEKSGGSVRMNINKGQKTLFGQFEVPVAQNNYREENGVKTTAITVFINAGSSDAFKYRYVYVWKEGAPSSKINLPEEITDNPLSGKWMEQENGDFWTFTPFENGLFIAKKTGKSEDTGLAILENDHLIVIYISEDRKSSGVYSLILSEDKRNLIGVWHDSIKIAKPVIMLKN